MSRLITVLLLLGGVYYLIHVKSAPPARSPSPPPAIVTAPAPPALSDAELEKIRNSTKDSDAKVRWAAVELLLRSNDPKAETIIAEMLTADSESEVRKRVIELLREAKSKSWLRLMLLGLKDAERDVRITTLQALSEVGDTSVVPAITETLKDYDPEVRSQALRALGRIQERRRQEYEALAAKLKNDYERSLKGEEPKLRDVRGVQ